MATVSLDWSEFAPALLAGGVLTIGNFDGVHLGHQALIGTARRLASTLGAPAIAVTFDPPPHQVLHPESLTLRPPLTTLADRAELLQRAGADHVVILRASPALLSLSPEAFFEDVVVRQLAARGIVEGYNFRFGRARAGTNDLLHRLCAVAGLAFEEVPQVLHKGEPVSSSRVRVALLAGDVALAAELLARPYRIAGKVTTGAKRGRTIGFPTANLSEIPTVLPGTGVYAAWATVAGKMWPAAINIGSNPTFGEDARKVEVHLIGFTGNLYDQLLQVDLVARLRDTQPFSSVAELTAQLQRDVEQVSTVLHQRSPRGHE
jgi:riboflavin kinase/FMN adenylyltransferase